MIGRRSVSFSAFIAVMLVGCATAGDSVVVNSEAAGSSYFSLGRPVVYKVHGGLELAGQACRRGRTTLLSPSRIRLEHVAVGGGVAEVAHAYLPPISRRADQPCSRYSTVAAWTFADGDAIRACFDRGHACPGAPPVKVAVPAAGARPTSTP
ncbi:MAG TPA: hypothetical protein VII73_00560 [Caulobacteraceae bacterium]